MRHVDANFKYIIIKYNNLHNKAINNLIMDKQSLLNMKMMQSQHKDIKDSLNCIIDTLTTDIKLQDKDDELNFSIEQFEMIMKSYRFDINQLRKIQIIRMFGTIINLLLISLLAPSYRKC